MANPMAEPRTAGLSRQGGREVDGGPRLPRAFCHEVVPLPSQWWTQPAAYIQISPAYVDDRTSAMRGSDRPVRPPPPRRCAQPTSSPTTHRPRPRAWSRRNLTTSVRRRGSRQSAASSVTRTGRRSMRRRRYLQPSRRVGRRSSWTSASWRTHHRSIFVHTERCSPCSRLARRARVDHTQRTLVAGQELGTARSRRIRRDRATSGGRCTASARSLRDPLRPLSPTTTR